MYRRQSLSFIRNLSLDNITDRLIRYADEQKRRPPPATSERIRAGQWINYPLLLSQPLVPIALYSFPLASVLTGIIVLIALNILWITVVSGTFVSLLLWRFGAVFALTKWVICPLIAVLLWREGFFVSGALALTWPLLIILLLVAQHRFWPPRALEIAMRRFRLAAARNNASPAIVSRSRYPHAGNE